MYVHVHVSLSGSQEYFAAKISAAVFLSTQGETDPHAARVCLPRVPGGLTLSSEVGVIMCCLCK